MSKSLNSSYLGKLWVVATPIGNLKDFSVRALEVLERVSLVLAEDTRHSATLLANFKLKKPLESLHKFNEQHKIQQVLKRLREGEELALISDAGTPLISDPGAELIKACHKEDIIVSAVPGACAAIAALSMAGMEGGGFSFIGFLPAKASDRQKRLQELSSVTSTLVFYEAPHRLTGCLKDLASVLGANRMAFVVKELTKVHETYLKATLSEQMAFWSEANLKGEWVLIVEGAAQNLKRDFAPVVKFSEDEARLWRLLLKQLPPKTAVKIMAEFTHQPAKALYQHYLARREGSRKPREILR